MGGRGASSGASGGGGGIVAGLNANKNQAGYQNGSWNTLQGVHMPGWDDNANPAIQKWQGQTDDKAARFLAKNHNDYQFVPDPNDPSGRSGGYIDPKTGEAIDTSGFNFYQGDFQRFSLATGMNSKPMVVDEKTFDAIQQQTGAQVLYRGEASQSQCDRFMNADYSHTGVGSFGDGYYFSQEAWVANDYADDKGGRNGRVMKMMLMPSARITNYNSVNSAIAGTSANLKSALLKQGNSAMSAYNNEGQAQMAIKQGYNVVTVSSDYHYAVDRGCFIVCKKTKHSW